LHTHSFTETINRTRAAILSRAITLQALPSADTAPKLPSDLAAAREAVKARAVTQAPTEAPAPRVVIKKPPVVKPTRSRPNREALEALGDLSEVKAGPMRLLELFHWLGLHVVEAKGYAVRPSQVTYHQSQELVARMLRVTTKTIQRWTRDLEALRLIATRAHYGSRKSDARIDGLVIAVSLKANHRAYLHYEDLAHQWRDLDADRQAGRTAWAALKAMSESVQTQEGQYLYILQNWAVCGSFTTPPLGTDSDIVPNTVQDVIYTLPLLPDLPPLARTKAVSQCAEALAHGLNDEHSRRWYARVIWDAITAEQNNIPALQPLAALLSRLEADMREWTGLRQPAALLNARLQGRV
jgi:hypothetical protein